MPDEGLQLGPIYVGMNKLIKTSVLCNWFNAYTCDLLKSMGMSHLKSKMLYQNLFYYSIYEYV
jgi:hypothetical protein